MKPVLQTKFGSEDGNCFEACVASILEVSIDDVATFVLGNPDDWFDQFVAWSAARKYHAIWIRDVAHVPKGFAIASIDRQQTPHGEIGHAIVVKDGVPVHCPTFGDKPRKCEPIFSFYVLVPFAWPLDFV